MEKSKFELTPYERFIENLMTGAVGLLLLGIFLKILVF